MTEEQKTDVENAIKSVSIDFDKVAEEMNKDIDEQKEELKQEAEEKASIYFDSLDYDHGDVSDTPFSDYDVFVAYKKGALDFAEPREKRIAELEAEVKEWKDKADLWCKTANLKDHNIMINKELERENAELKAFKEKQNQDILILKGLTERQREENAELKEQLGDKVMQKLKDKADLVWNLKTANEQKADQLTNAKELLKNLLDVAKFYNKHRDKGAIMDITPIYDAEQFLKESEVEK